VIIGSLLATLALAPTPALAQRAAPPRSSTTVGVSAREYAFAVYRETVPAGTVTLVLHNYGEDAHDVQIRGPHGYRSATSADLAPDGTLRFRAHLRRPGRYLLVCTKPGHLALGMKAALRVR
jgi:plastocyanin